MLKEETGEGEVVSWRYLTTLTLPMMLSFLMMSGSAPIITGGITWRYGPLGERLHLSAFLLSFAVAICLYSPIFIARNVAIRTVTDRDSLRRHLSFFFWVSLVGAVLILLVARVDFLGDPLFEQLLGATPQQTELARGGLALYAILPLLISLRSAAQACHINNNQAWICGAGSTLRVLSMFAFVAGYAMRQPWITGPILGGLAFVVGIGTETLLVSALLYNKPQLKRGQTGGARLLSYRQYLQYTLPLMSGTMIRTFVPPLIISLIALTGTAREGMAAYDLLRSTIWIGLSAIFALQPMMISCATSRENLRRIISFSLGVVLVIVSGFSLIVFTPLRQMIYETALQVDNHVILTLLYQALPWLLLLPLLMGSDMLLHGLLTRSGKTIWSLLGNATGALLLLGAGHFLKLGQANGVLVAILALLCLHLVNISFLGGWLLSGGLDRALSKKNLADALTA